MTPQQRGDLAGYVVLAAVYVVGLWLLVSGCVTRTTVCVEHSRALGPRDGYGSRPDSVGASVCAEVERP